MPTVTIGKPPVVTESEAAAVTAQLCIVAAKFPATLGNFPHTATDFLFLAVDFSTARPASIELSKVCPVAHELGPISAQLRAVFADLAQIPSDLMTRRLSSRVIVRIRQNWRSKRQ
jgi:hypothetical protein